MLLLARAAAPHGRPRRAGRPQGGNWARTWPRRGSTGWSAPTAVPDATRWACTAPSSARLDEAGRKRNRVLWNRGAGNNRAVYGRLVADEGGLFRLSRAELENEGCTYSGPLRALLHTRPGVDWPLIVVSVTKGPRVGALDHAAATRC